MASYHTCWYCLVWWLYFLAFSILSSSSFLSSRWSTDSENLTPLRPPMFKLWARFTLEASLNPGKVWLKTRKKYPNVTHGIIIIKRSSHYTKCVLEIVFKTHFNPRTKILRYRNPTFNLPRTKNFRYSFLTLPVSMQLWT